MKNELPKIVAIVGTNASGKSSIGIELAKKFNGEIISADSRQVFRGFDLCCGKITDKEAQIVPHYLLNIKNIGESFSVFDFQKMAYSIIPKISHRGRIPFIVGGTGLYVRSVVEGFPFSERSPDLEMRDKLGKLPIDELQAMLTPEAKMHFSSNPSELQNKRRLIVMLEKISYGEPVKPMNTVRYNALQLGITWPKEELHKRIDERLETRIKQGMIDEVKTYLDNGGNREYLKTLGLEYGCILRFLMGEFRTLDEFKSVMSHEIKQFAKRQLTFFNDNKYKPIHWLDMSADYFDEACSLISEFLE